MASKFYKSSKQVVDDIIENINNTGKLKLDEEYSNTTFIDGGDINEVYRSGKIYGNALHKFATYNTIFTLSGLSKQEIEELGYLDVTNTPHDIIARSGGIGDPNISWGKYDQQSNVGTIQQHSSASSYERKSKHTKSFEPSVNILAKGHDLFFENVNILSTVGPNPERGLANFTKMEFELHEPFGVTFVEKIRACAFINGFLDYQDAPLLLTIEWIGNSQEGRPGVYTNGVNLTSGFSSKPIIRKIPILISRVQFDVDQGGAKYQCVAVPYGDLAFDDRFKFPRTQLNVTATTLTDKKYQKQFLHQRRGIIIKQSTQPLREEKEHVGTWVEQVESQLDQQMEDEIKEDVRQYADKYRFIVSREVLAFGEEYFHDLTTTKAEETKGILQRLFGSPNLPEVNIKLGDVESGIDMKTALPRFFEDAIRSLLGYQHLVDRFWYTYGSILLRKEHDTKTTQSDTILQYIKNSGQFEKDLEANQYVDWFMIKPHVITHTELPFDNIRKVHRKTIIYYAIPTKIHLLKFIKPGVSFGNIDWNKYVRKQYDYIYTGNNVDVQSLKIDYKSAYYMRNVRPLQTTSVAKGKYEKFAENLERQMKKVFAGGERYPEPALPLRQEPSLIRGKNTMSTIARAKSQEFYDYITNPQADMMKIELEILGDPAFISQDMYTTLHGKGRYWRKSVYNHRYDSFNVEQYQPLIKVNYRLPDEIEENEGVMFQKQLSYGESLFFNGIYQVTKVESRFQSGEFTQVLTCVRLNNQKGTGKGELMSSGDIKEFFPNKESDDKKKKRKIIDTDELSEYPIGS